MFQTVVLEKTLESPLDSKEIKPVNPRGNQPWIFILRTDAEAEVSILWPPDAKSRLIRKDPDASRDWRQKTRAAEDEIGRQHHQLSGFEQTPERQWRTGEPAVLQSMGSQRVGHNWATSLSKITADSDFSHEMKRCLLLGRKAMTNLNRVLKDRVITLLTKVHIVKAMIFPVVMYGCESWTIKKAEHQRIDGFK